MCDRAPGPEASAPPAPDSFPSGSDASDEHHDDHRQPPRRNRPTYFARLGLACPPDVLRATAARMSALNATASTFSPSCMSIARLVFPSRLELKSSLLQ